MYASYSPDKISLGTIIVAAISLAMAMALAAQVAPGIAPETVVSFACKESGSANCRSFDPLAIHDNETGQSYSPPTIEAAVVLAERLILAARHSVDLGLMQINFPAAPTRMGMTIKEAFVPRRSMQTGTKIIREAFETCIRSYKRAVEVMACTGSYYNTGRDGEVGRRYARGLFQLAAFIPSIKEVATASIDATIDGKEINPPPQIPTKEEVKGPPPPPSWDVWGKEDYRRRRDAGSDNQKDE